MFLEYENFIATHFFQLLVIFTITISLVYWCIRKIKLSIKIALILTVVYFGLKVFDVIVEKFF